MLIYKKLLRNLLKIKCERSMKSSFSHGIKLRVRYSETDQMGYCYYGNYASYFEVGRVEALRSLGMSYKSLEEEGIMLPVSHFEVDYRSPAFYDDELSITTRIVETAGARLFFEYDIHNDAGKLISQAKTTLVFVNKATMRPIPAPERFLSLIGSHAVRD